MNRLRTRNQREQNVLIEFLPDDRRRNNTNADAIKNCLLDRGKTAEFNNFAWVQLIFFYINVSHFAVMLIDAVYK